VAIAATVHLPICVVQHAGDVAFRRQQEFDRVLLVSPVPTQIAYPSYSVVVRSSYTTLSESRDVKELT
jgi:hypothetical protein